VLLSAVPHPTSRGSLILNCRRKFKEFASLIKLYRKAFIDFAFNNSVHSLSHCCECERPLVLSNSGKKRARDEDVSSFTCSECKRNKYNERRREGRYDESQGNPSSHATFKSLDHSPNKRQFRMWMEGRKHQVKTAKQRIKRLEDQLNCVKSRRNCIKTRVSDMNNEENTCAVHGVVSAITHAMKDADGVRVIHIVFNNRLTSTHTLYCMKLSIPCTCAALPGKMSPPNATKCRIGYNTICGCTSKMEREVTEYSVKQYQVGTSRRRRDAAKPAITRELCQ